MEIKKFKTESKRLLDLMANSIYTNKDIFLRELISNASDAIDKKRYLALTNTNINTDDLKININIDKENRIITISDNGIGMSEEELNQNLGTIAKSGSFEFKKELDTNSNVDIIGQFGVGFYSSYMVADKIEVISKKYDSDDIYKFISENEEGYFIEKINQDIDFSTKIILKIKENNQDFEYDKYLDEYYIETLIKKYSDFISYPIYLKKNDKEEIINTMIPLWKKDKKDIKTEDYDNFYLNNYFDFEKTIKTLHYKIEGNSSYTALIFIPSKAPNNYYSADFKTGISLYSKGVFIKDNAQELVSDYFRFIRGVIDSEDLNLNISREILQIDNQVNNLKKSIDKKIKTTLETMLKNEREDYEKFFDSFGLQLKYGCYEKYGLNKDILIDLLLFKSSHNDKYTTLKEYVERMKENQKEIYFASGDNIDNIKRLPQLEKILNEGYEVLYLKDHIDEFMLEIIKNYDNKEFKSINKVELSLLNEKEQEIINKQSEDNKDLINKLKELLKDKVSDVKLSNKLISYPVCISNDGDISIEMEKVLKQYQNQIIDTKKILEINPNHDIFNSLLKAYENNENLDDYAYLLYNQALLIEGLELEDVYEFNKILNKIILKSIK